MSVISSPMSPIISTRAESDDSDEMAEARFSIVNSVFLMAYRFFSDAKIFRHCAKLKHKHTKSCKRSIPFILLDFSD